MADLPLAERHETMLPPAPAEAREALAHAMAVDAEARKTAVGAVVADHPTLLDGWASLAGVASDDIERYAYARVGYHRGLDALRAAGWGGRGFVRWSQPTNRAFLTCLVRLRAAADAIGEDAEVARITAFLHDLDPDWDDADVAG
jgi:hypothetical protein